MLVITTVERLQQRLTVASKNKVTDRMKKGKLGQRKNWYNGFFQNLSKVAAKAEKTAKVQF